MGKEYLTKGGKMIKPILKNIVIKPIDNEKKTAGGIIIPDNAGERPQLGVVIHAGESKFIKKNDEVYFKKWGGDEVKEGDQEYLIIREEDVLAIYEK